MTKEFRSSKSENFCKWQKSGRSFLALAIRISFVIRHSSFSKLLVKEHHLAGRVRPSVAQIAGIASSAPNNHFATRPPRGVDGTRTGRARRRHPRPTVARRTIAPSVVKGARCASTPDDHFAARPHRRVVIPRGGRASGAHHRPTVARWIV